MSSRKFASLLAVMILVIAIKPAYAPSHPERIGAECAVSDGEKASLMEALLNHNASWNSYGEKQLTNVYCYYAPLYPEPYPTKPPVPAGAEPAPSVVAVPDAPMPVPPSPVSEEYVKFISGNLELRRSGDDIKYLVVYFSASADGAVKIQSVWEQENYDFERFFSKDENEKLDYFLKKLIIDLSLNDTEDKGIWMSLQSFYWGPVPLAEEKTAVAMIRPPGPQDCTEHRKAFDDFVSRVAVEDKFYFEQPYSCTGLFKSRLSSARGLASQLPENHMLSYFGDSLRFSYSGEARVPVNLPAVVAKLKEEGCFVVSNNEYPEKPGSSCYAYYNDRTFGFFFNRQYGVSAFGDNTYANANLWGPVGGKGVLYVSLSGERVDAYLPFVEQEMEQALKEAGIIVDVKLQKQEQEKSCIMIYPPPPGCGPAPELKETAVAGSAGGAAVSGISIASPTAVAREYVTYTFSQEVAVPDKAPDWESEDMGYAVYYRSGNAGVAINKASLSINKQENGSYWYASFSEDAASTSVTLNEFSVDKAKQALSDAVAAYADIPADAWKVDYYPVGEGPVIYYARGVATAEKAIAVESAAAPAIAPVTPASAPGAASVAKQESQAIDFQGWVKAEAQKEDEQRFTVQKFFRGILDWLAGLIT